MGLTDLPPELLEPIITYATPEGFESLALSCRGIYALCKPSIARHNALKSRFETFVYGAIGELTPFPILSAFHLLAYLIDNPLAARYIRHADFTHDGRRYWIPGRPYDVDAEESYLDALEKTIAASPLLEQAGVDLEEFCSAMREKVFDHRYSQQAATFLLTLLPNVESLTLPEHWRPLESTDRIVSRIVEKANQLDGFTASASLARLRTFRNSTSLTPRSTFELLWAKPFLELSTVKTFHGRSLVETPDSPELHSPEYFSFWKLEMDQGIEHMDLTNCYLSEKLIESLLRRTPRLRSFQCSHRLKEHDPGYPIWAIHETVSAIADHVGDHLEDLSLTFKQDGHFGIALPGTACQLGFKSLEVLELPLEMASANIEAARYNSTADRQPNEVDVFDQMVPATVRELSLVLQPTTNYEDTLEVLFHNLDVKKHRRNMKLEKIHLTCPDESSDKYRDQFTMLQQEMNRAGVVLHTHPFPQPFRTMI